jgi:hypothetical protein
VTLDELIEALEMCRKARGGGYIAVELKMAVDGVLYVGLAARVELRTRAVMIEADEAEFDED